MGFSRQEYWSGLPFPSPGDLPDPGTEPMSPALQADALTSEPPGKPTSVGIYMCVCVCVCVCVCGYILYILSLLDLLISKTPWMIFNIEFFKNLPGKFVLG